MPGSAGHLIRRFFAVSAAQALGNAELAQVEDWLSSAEFDLFLSQPPADQRHGYEAGMHVQAHGGERPVIAAGALHDIGKRHAGLGPIGRTVATLMILLGLSSRWGRAAAYRDHGPVAAVELDRAGSDPVVVAFARHHHDSRPPEVGQATWALLVAADEPVKASRSLRPPIT